MRYLGEVIGMASHAGTTPMDRRRDAAAAVAELILFAEQRAAKDGDSVATVGMLEVPERLHQRGAGPLPVQPGPARAQRRAARCTRRRRAGRAKEICERRGVRHTLEETMRAAAAPSAPDWQQRWEHAVDSARRAAVPHAQRRRPRRDEAARSHAAGHAVRARQNSGISHNPLESTTSDDMQLAVPGLPASARQPRHRARTMT